MIIELRNVYTVKWGLCNLAFDGQRIIQIDPPCPCNRKIGAHIIDLEGNFILPGLINSHDHLDFNLFPQLGNKFYEDYLAWGTDIHHCNKTAIRDSLFIPKQLRIRWGIYKNLLNGITTVVQHGEKMKIPDAPIEIFNKCHNLHSVHLEKGWRGKILNPFFQRWPFVIHIGEGTNLTAKMEIDELLKWNVWNRKLIGIHGVAMNEKQAEGFKAIIWCPDSNLFLLGKTASVDRLKSSTTILFGSDSTLSADWNIWKHLRLARSTGMLNDVELMNSLSSSAAAIWNMKQKGDILMGNDADLLVLRNKENHITSTFPDLKTIFDNDPEDILMVISKGNIVLFDEMLLHQIKHLDLNEFGQIYINHQLKYVKGNLPFVIREIKKLNPRIHFPVQLVD